MSDDGRSGVSYRQRPVEPDSPAPGRRDDVVVMLGAGDPENLLHRVKQQLPGLLDTAPAAIVVDLSGMGRLSSGAVSALLWMGGACRRRGIPVRLRDLPRGGSTTLRRTGVRTALALDEAGS